MCTRLLFATFVILGGCAKRTAEASHTVQTPRDSAQIIGAAWRAASELHMALRPAVFWSSSGADTGRFVPMSAYLQRMLVEAGVPLEPRVTTGDDTVVFRLTSWARESSSALLELRSTWTTVLRAGSPRPCRTGSINVERFRVRRRGNAWTAERDGPVLHGDKECVPIPPA